jgi:hypothetical protein
MVNLDMILISPEWGQHFPLCKVSCLVRVGSDHAPIMLNTGEENVVRGAHFHFEKQWLPLPNFKEEVFMKMAESMLAHRDNCALDMWQWMMAHLRNFLRGYEANIKGDQRKRKDDLKRCIAELDEKADKDELDSVGWANGYCLEEELI